MCLVFDSQTHCHTWIEFVGSLLCSNRFFPGFSGFPLWPKTNIWICSVVISFYLCTTHCIGDLSGCVADFGFPIQRNYFETSHAKGEQDTAGSPVKQQASLAVIRGRPNITNAKQLCDHLTGNFSKPAQSSFPSRSTAESLKRRLLFYVPAEGEWL